jgi:phage protein D
VSTLAARPVYERADRSEETFYAPAFELRVGGAALPAEASNDVLRVSYHDAIDEIDSFELTLNNWDAATRRFKYVGIDRELATGAGQPAAARLFDPGTRIELRMGYLPQTRLALMISGQITALEPDFSGGGAPTLRVRGLNVLHALRAKQHTWAWTDGERDSDVARDIGRRRPSADRPGLGMDVRVDDAAAAAEPDEQVIFMNNQHDVVFLLERARRRGYVLSLERDDSGRERLYFGPSEQDRTEAYRPYRLVWGQSLMDFRPVLTTVDQVAQVTVRGWNRRTASAIVGTASVTDRGLGLNDDQRAVASAVQARHEVVADKPIRSEKEARELAKAVLLRRLREMITATGSTVGLPDLRAGRKVQIAGLGERFGGTYFVRSTTHTIGESGYRTTFEVHRESGEGAT